MVIQNSINMPPPVTVGKGGTGLTTADVGGFLTGSGGAATINQAFLSDGQIFVGITDDFPVAITPTSDDDTIVVTGGSGTLNFDIKAPVGVIYGGTGATSLTANGMLYGNGTSAVVALSAMTNGQIVIGTTGSAPVVSTITAGEGISITNGAGSITIDNTGYGSGGFKWQEVTSPTNTTGGMGYIANSGSTLVLVLPLTAAIGDTFRIVGKGAGGWQLNQSGSQVIYFGTATTTIGLAGSLASTNRYDCIEITCITADTEFVATAPQGNITYV